MVVLKKEHPQEPASSGTQKLRQDNYKRDKERCQIAKYYTDWEQVDKEDAPTLVETVARYLSSTTNSDCEVIMAILGIKIEEGKR